MEYYDNKIQDAPLKDINKFRVTPWPGLQYCPIANADDPEVPFAEGIDHNEMVEEDLENRSFEDKRIQHLDFRNTSFSEAILKGALTAKKQEQQEDA
jgi:uncharacterized protein YjbI with pentapeptide repeats